MCAMTGTEVFDDEMEFAPSYEDLKQLEDDLESGDVLAEPSYGGPYNSALDHYLAVALKTPLLNAEEEVALSRRIKSGDMIAHKKMVEANTRIVVNIARRLHRDNRVDLIDLIAEGNIGLMRAIDQYDPERGFRFSTYATWWIRQTIQRWIKNNVRTVRWPIHIHNRYTAYQRYLTEQGKGKLFCPVAAKEALGLTDKQFREVQALHNAEVSLTAPISEDGESQALVDLLMDSQAECAEDKAHSSTVRDTLERLMDEVLNPRQREVLRMRFAQQMTLQDVSDNLQKRISPERVRQVESEAIERLRRRLEFDGVTLHDFIQTMEVSDGLVA